LFLCAAAFTGTAHAERLPLKSYTTIDGLPHNRINKIVRDSRGFLWFCTEEGLSRFDGYQFTNYGTDQGLPHAAVTDFLETRRGELWVATGAGVARFNPKGAPTQGIVSADKTPAAVPMFATIVPDDEDRRARYVTVLREGRDGTIWVGTRKGLYQLERADGYFHLRRLDTEWPERSNPNNVWDLVEDRRGSLWIAYGGALGRRWPDGSAAHYSRRDGLPDNQFHDLLEDHQGRLWAGTRGGGFFRFTADETHAPPVIQRVYAARDGLASDWVAQLFETSDRRFWVATAAGLAEFFPEAARGESTFKTYNQRNGLLYYALNTLAEDAGGNLWLGSDAGAMRLARYGFISYGEQDGLMIVFAIFGNLAGRPCFRASVFGDERLSVFEGAKSDLLHPVQHHHTRYGCFDRRQFTWLKPDALDETELGWVGEMVTLQTRNGEWWLGTGAGVYRFGVSDNFAQLKQARPLAVYTTKDGLRGAQVFRLFEDSRGDVWVSTIMGPSGLARWERAAETWHDVTNSTDLPSPADDLARSFGEDRDGNVWIGFNTGVARYRRGRFAFFSGKDGLPPGSVMSVHLDRQGRLWLTSARSGVIRVDHPGAERPSFTNYTTAQGLSSNVAEAITEDLDGHIYVGTGRGVDRLDPAKGHIKHFTTADGLAAGEVKAAFRAGDGALWFGTGKGLSRLVPGTDTGSPAPPPILITALSIAGERQPLSALGETEKILTDLAPDRTSLQIDFVGLSFAPGEVLRYQYWLEGADSDWGAPTEQRSVNYARLAPGKYRFFVRAVNSDGAVSVQPAVVTFTILAPIWQRWWFLMLAALTLSALALAAHRYRMARRLELERVRSRIASDLHDDIGAGLSRIAVLSEVARHDADGVEPVEERLAVIASASRELVDSMSDIVWVVNPRRDRLQDLVQRMRRFASDVFTARETRFTFRTPADERPLKVSADVRRHVFLIFKEAINNIVRHAGCTTADIELRITGSQFVLTVRDDGHGFDPARAGDGNGLANMRARARAIGGDLRVESASGHGTSVMLTAPLRAMLHEPNGRQLPGARA
jgi:signal transduction histidine kinase/ligand-binding sensor domain-containing protein